MGDEKGGDAPRLGDILLAQGNITSEQLQNALDVQNKTGDFLGEILIHMGYADAPSVYRVLSRQRGIPYIDVTHIDIEAEVLQLIPREFAEKFTVLPLFVEGTSIKIAVADHLDVTAFDGISTMTALSPDTMLSSRTEIRKAIRENYARPDQLEHDMQRLLDDERRKEQPRDEETPLKGQEPETPAVRFVNLMLEQAVERKASDLHLEPHKDSATMRYRIDGILHDAPPPTRAMYAAVVSRIKVLSNLDISQRRLPQDGRFRMDDYDIDIRVSTIPTIHGEKLLMRFLDKHQLVLDLSKTGFTEDQGKAFTDALSEPQGIILVTGPTGSGKTTTLYSGIAYVNTPDVNIMTVEDPVEYVFPNINQIQVNPEIGLKFASVLRSMLRQDPDVLMVGEIRDRETGEIAVRASMTGHLVLSTLHTQNAINAIDRLESMGVQPYLLASSLRLIVAQRLVRRICYRCKEPHDPLPESLEALGLDPKGEYFKGKGCQYCNKTGYRGRIAVFEMLPVTKELSRLIARSASEDEFEQSATCQKMLTLRQSGAVKAAEGSTTVEEVLSKTPAEKS